MKVLIVGAIAPPLVNKISAGCLPFGAMALSSYLKRQHVQCVVVSTAFPDSVEQICAELGSVGLVGISSMSGPYLSYGISVAKNIRRIRPSLPIVWGGPHATLCDDEIISSGLGDFVVRGTGELPLHKLLLCLEGAYPLSTVPNLTYQESGVLRRNERDFDFKIDDLPPLDYSIMERYPGLREGDFFYFTSRGCPFNCSFCVASELYNRRWHPKSEENVVAELMLAHEKYGFDSLFFMDDNVFVNAARLRGILEETNRSGLHFEWSGFCRADTLLGIDDRLISELKERGLKQIYIGAESGCQETLDRLNKGVLVEDIKEAVMRLREFDIGCDFSFMGGIPKETAADFKRTLLLVEWIKNINPCASVRVFRFIPYPRMPILDGLGGIGAQLPKSSNGWCAVNYYDTRFPWVPKMVDRILQVLAPASHCGIKPKVTSLKTLALSTLYHLVNFRIKYSLYCLPLEGWVLTRISKVLSFCKLKNFQNRLHRGLETFLKE